MPRSLALIDITVNIVRSNDDTKMRTNSSETISANSLIFKTLEIHILGHMLK